MRKNLYKYLASNLCKILIILITKLKYKNY